MAEKNILIVEDEAVTGMGIRKSLIDLGYSVIGIVPTGEQGVRTTVEQRPDLVLMDIRLAGRMNGIVAAKLIHDQTGVPVVFLSAYSDDRVVQSAKVAGAYGYILKPVREQELKTTIEIALHKHAADQALRISEETTRVLLNATDEMHFLMDRDANIILANEQLAGKAGRPGRALAGTPVYDLVSRGILSPRMVGWNMLPDQTGSIRFEEEFGGSWFVVSMDPVRDPSGTAVRFAVHIHDITREKKIQEQLLRNEEIFRTLIEEISDLIVILNRDGTFKHESPSLAAIVGWTSEQAAGRTLFDVLQKEDVERVRQLVSQVWDTPFMVRAFQCAIRDVHGGAANVEGVICNVLNNPVIEGIALCGWIVSRS
ncbi:MAG: response regulator [Methanoregulaceae archaeon]|jgi:PAS domain S-box-containing protein